VYVADGFAGLLHFDGVAWTTALSGLVQAVWGTARDNVYAGGLEGGIDIARYDGVSWTPMTLPPESCDFDILSIHGAGGDVFAVDTNGSILRAAGNSWSLVSFPTAVWVAHADDVYVTGADGIAHVN
jgi:hypothetical protein